VGSAKGIESGNEPVFGKRCPRKWLRIRAGCDQRVMSV
jgi:hypothetical protein